MSDEELKALADAFRQKLALDPEIRAAEKKIAEGKADFSDTSRMFWRRSELLGDYMQGIVPDLAPEDRERLAEALLRMGYNDTNGVLVPLQEALDEPLGVHLTPVVPKYPAERVATVAHALMDPTVPEEKIVRRAGAPVANVNMSFHDKYMEENARIRARLGMKPTITRYGSGCCKWCSEVAGRYRFGDQPKDIFRRHDNCGCTIIYDNQVLRGHRNEDGGSSRAWEAVDPAEVMRQAQEPVRYSAEDAKSLQNTALDMLTMRGTGGIMRVSGATSGALNHLSKEADEHAKRYYAAVRRMTTDVSRISENTGYSKELVQSIKDFVFNEKHDLGDRYDYFDPDYMMAQSWQRLIEGKNIQPHDLTLLKHEQMEHELMQQGYSQSEAHLITSQKYNYGKEAEEFYDRIEKHNKE